jgi:hypothetical protein
MAQTGTIAERVDLSPADGQALTAEAATWEGTPYSLLGAGSVKGVGGDCSGSTWLIYKAAGFPYEYQQAAGFAAYALRTGLFRELAGGDARQDGDILSWPNHMAIVSTFVADPAHATTARTNRAGHPWTQKNDMWTASHPGGPAYACAELRFWRNDPPRVFRYQKAR